MDSDNSARGSGLCRRHLPNILPPLGHSVKDRKAYHYRTEDWTQTSITKTKHMRMNSRTNEPIKLQGENIEEVEEFTYLGYKITADGSSEREIRAMLPKAGQAFATLRNVWKSGKIRRKMKIYLFKSSVLSILLYGSKSWKITKALCALPHEED